ncbi:MAG: hypothetical protein NZ954_00115 [Thermofilaceae archaeon]|nr:hypothetical protein [Thermofilaceae archaeon]MCX8180733.1 hypothetical protein [Thermofilaceae archaeon]MDW8003952.1 hypothetical protein [Thermofilaceae archaeon]
MSSNAGSTRRIKLIAAIVLGTSLSVLAVLLSFWAMYYSSPRMQVEKQFDIMVKDVSSFIFPLPDASGERIYYYVNVSSSKPVEFSIKGIFQGQVLDFIDFGKSTRFERGGNMLLNHTPSELVVTLKCVDCLVKGYISIRYSSVDYRYLTVLNIAAVASSIVGLSLLAAGGYGYMISRGEKEGAR